MINRIKKLASFMNVSGAENDLSQYLYESLVSNGIKAEKDCNGCVIARCGNFTKNRKKILISVPIDIPGYIALHLENKELYLAPTNKEILNNASYKELVDEEGKKFRLKKSKFDEKEYSVTCQNGKIGKVFRPLLSFGEEQKHFYGSYICKYALVDFLLELSKKKFDGDLSIAFSTSFYTNEICDANIAFREHPDLVILLGFAENDGDKTIVPIKNGKHFSNQVLLKKLENSCEKQIDFKVYDEEITKQISVFNACNAEIVTLALPYFVKNNEEVLTKKSIDNFKKVIDCILK